MGRGKLSGHGILSWLHFLLFGNLAPSAELVQPQVIIFMTERSTSASHLVIESLMWIHACRKTSRTRAHRELVAESGENQQPLGNICLAKQPGRGVCRFLRPLSCHASPRSNAVWGSLCKRQSGLQTRAEIQTLTLKVPLWAAEDSTNSSCQGGSISLTCC